MRKLTSAYLFTPLILLGGLLGADARSAELEGALQYPPALVGQDAQPPPPLTSTQVVEFWVDPQCSQRWS
jgi:hypothetical protein